MSYLKIENKSCLTPFIAQTVNKLKGKVTILFITHQLPKGLQVDEAVILGKEGHNKHPRGEKQQDDKNM
jgi:ABC-type transport system involved in cytochrome bd biosynthesis fused ATPase/permease subunit